MTSTTILRRVVVFAFLVAMLAFGTVARAQLVWASTGPNSRLKTLPAFQYPLWVFLDHDPKENLNNIPKGRFSDRPAEYTVKPFEFDNPPENEAEERLREFVAETLAHAHPVPAERLWYFQSYEESPLVFTGWFLVVEQVLRTTTGWKARVRVSPTVLTTGATPACAVSALNEEYEMTNGQLRFLGGHGKRRAEDGRAPVSYTFP